MHRHRVFSPSPTFITSHHGTKGRFVSPSYLKCLDRIYSFCGIVSAAQPPSQIVCLPKRSMQSYAEMSAAVNSSHARRNTHKLNSPQNNKETPVGDKDQDSLVLDTMRADGGTPSCQGGKETKDPPNRNSLPFGTRPRLGVE